MEHMSYIVGGVCLLSVVLGLIAGFRQRDGDLADIGGAIFLTILVTLAIGGVLGMAYFGLTNQL